MKTTLTKGLAAALIGLSLSACATSVSTSAATNIKAYPLETCIVTDNDLDSMGGEIVKTYEGQQIKFCCKPCIKKFEANPPKYLKKLL